MFFMIFVLYDPHDLYDLAVIFLQQEGGLCAQHCLNSLLQGTSFSSTLLLIVQKLL